MLKYQVKNFVQYNKSLTLLNKQGYKLRYPASKPTIYEQEKKEYKIQLKESRKKNFEEYWQRQTIVENNFIEKYQQEQNLKQKNDELNYRTSIINISYQTDIKIKNIQKKELERQKKFEKMSLEKEIQRLNRLKILKILNIESQDWYTPDNIDKKMKDSLLIPEVVYDQTDYYLKLQEQALLFEQADYEGLDNALSEVKYIKYKNRLIMPIYLELTSIIKHMHNTDISKLQNEYQTAMAQLFKQKDQKSMEQFKQEALQLNSVYESLLINVKEQLEKPKNKIEFLEKNLILLYNLLKKWVSYMEIVKMNNTQIALSIEKQKKAFGIQEDDEDDDDFQVQKNDWSDAQTSAAENMTSDSDEEIDLSNKEETAMNQEQRQQLEKQFDSMDFDDQEVPKEKSQNTHHKKIDELFDQMENNKQMDKEIDEQFDDMIIKQASKEQILYGFDNQKEAIDAQKYLKLTDLDMVFPQNVIEDLQNFEIPKIQFQTVQDIQRDQMQSSDNQSDPSQLNSNFVVEAYKQQLNQLYNEKTLNKQQQKKVINLLKMLDNIAEFQIKEPQMLLKVWNLYSNQ